MKGETLREKKHDAPNVCAMIQFSYFKRVFVSVKTKKFHCNNLLIYITFSLILLLFVFFKIVLNNTEHLKRDILVIIKTRKFTKLNYFSLKTKMCNLIPYFLLYLFCATLTVVLVFKMS